MRYRNPITALFVLLALAAPAAASAAGRPGAVVFSKASTVNGVAKGGLFAAKDEGISPDTIQRFEVAMKKAGKRLAGAHVYADCDNGFMDPANRGRARAAAVRATADAWQRIGAFLGPGR